MNIKIKIDINIKIKIKMDMNMIAYIQIMAEDAKCTKNESKHCNEMKYTNQNEIKKKEL